MYRHPYESRDAQQRRAQRPFIQIDTDTWIVMRNHVTHPVAVIEHIPSVEGISKYLVRRWDPVPSRRPLVSIHDTLEAANDSVPWDNSAALRAARDGVPQVTSDGLVPAKSRRHLS